MRWNSCRLLILSALIFWHCSDDIDTTKAARSSLMNDNHCTRLPVEAVGATAEVAGAVRLRQLLYQHRQPAVERRLHSLFDQGPHSAVLPTMKADHPDSGRTQPVVDCRLPPYWLQSVNNIPWPFIAQVGPLVSFICTLTLDSGRLNLP